MPKIREVIAVNGQRVVKHVPMFPRYIFVLINGQWRSIMSTRGVQELFLLGNEPHKIPVSKVVELRAFEAMQAREDNFAGLGLKPGDQARVVTGALADKIVVFEKCARKRVQVLFDWLGRSVRAEVGIGDLEPV